ncbi:MAG TPA: helix-turn-helix domain-containing protein [Planctomycetota bacterium]|nr:helix-turn-helix domain-containing protein [Planctomycetota bacterium]
MFTGFEVAMLDIDGLFARRVRELRIRQGLSQEALSLSAGQHPRYVSQIERGKRGPTLRAALRLAAALHVSIAELVEQRTTAPEPRPGLERVLALLRKRREPELAIIEGVIKAIYGEEHRPTRGSTLK